MAVFEYRGLVAATGKQVHGVRDADNAKVLRALLRREGVLLTKAQEETKARRAQARRAFVLIWPKACCIRRLRGRLVWIYSVRHPFLKPTRRAYA